MAKDIIRLTKEFRFEAAHALWNYDGLCKHIHGHSYRLVVTVKGSPCEDRKSSKYGMVMDFSDLKSIVKESIVNKFDHALILYKDADNESMQKDNPLYSNIILTDFNPTSENMVIYFADIIKKKLPAIIELYNIKLYETPNSFAEYNCEDNH